MQDKTIDYILRYTWQAVARMYNEEATKYGATMATGFALLSIDKEKGTPSTTLGPKMGMEATSLTRTLKSMEDKGLIFRKKNPADGRGVLIYLTNLGKEKRELSKNTVLLFNETVKANLSDEKLKNFIEVSEIINQLITDKKIFRDMLQNIIPNRLIKDRVKIGFFMNLDNIFDFRKNSIQKIIFSSKIINKIINKKYLKKIIYKKNKTNPECHFLFSLLNITLYLQMYKKNIN